MYKKKEGGGETRARARNNKGRGKNNDEKKWNIGKICQNIGLIEFGEDFWGTWIKAWDTERDDVYGASYLASFRYIIVRVYGNKKSWAYGDWGNSCKYGYQKNWTFGDWEISCNLTLTII